MEKHPADVKRAIINSGNPDWLTFAVPAYATGFFVHPDVPTEATSDLPQILVELAEQTAP